MAKREAAPALTARRLELTVQATRAFSEAVHSYDELPRIVSERIATATGDVCAVRLFSEDGLRLLPSGGHHPDPEVRADMWQAMRRTIPSDDVGVWQAAIKGRKLVRLVVDPANPPVDAAPAQVEFMRKHRVGALLVAPLVARGRMLGGIALTRVGGGPPHTDAEVSFLEDLADRAALAIDNARLLRDLRLTEERLRAANADQRARLSHLDVVTAAGRAFAARTTDLRGLGQAIVEHVAAAIGDACVVWLRPTDGGPRLDFLAARHRDSTIDRVLSEAVEPFIAYETRADERLPSELFMATMSADQVRANLRPAFRARPELVRPVVSIFAVLRARQRDVGLLVVSRAEERPAFTSADEALLADLADRAALALDAAQLHEAAHAELAERERAEAALRSSTNQQMVLLQLGRAALEGVALPTLFDAAVSMAMKLLRVERAILFLRPEQGDELQVGATLGWADGGMDALAVIGAQVGHTLQLGQAVIVPDPTDVRSVVLDDAWQARGVATGVTVVIPGTLGFAPRGVFAVHTAEQRRFTSEEVAFLEGVGNVVGAGIARKQAEDATFRREEVFRALVEHTPDIITRFDRQSRHLYVNPAVERATGESAASFLGRTLREVGIPGPVADRIDLVVAQVFRTGREQSIEFALQSPTGQREYQARITPEFASDGTVESVLSVARNITEQRKAEDERTALVQEVIQREARLQDLVSRMLATHAEDTRRTIGSTELERLTGRERQILRMVVAGQTNRQIAYALGLAAGTVKNHVARLLPKLDAADRTQAAVRAVEYGLLDSDGDERADRS